MEIITKNASDTQELGQEIGSKLKGGEVLALTGDLGSGKTTFVQGLTKGLGIKERILSPTFILMRSYENFYHLDLYRLEKNVWQEVQNLGVEEIWKNKKNVMVIEWAEKIKDHLPKDTTWIEFENVGEERRKIVIKNK